MVPVYRFPNDDHVNSKYYAKKKVIKCIFMNFSLIFILMIHTLNYIQKKI